VAEVCALLNAVLVESVALCVAESDAQTTVVVPQCNRVVLLRESVGTWRDAETVQHQTKDSELRASFMAWGSPVDLPPYQLVTFQLTEMWKELIATAKNWNINLLRKE